MNHAWRPGFFALLFSFTFLFSFDCSAVFRIAPANRAQASSTDVRQHRHPVMDFLKGRASQVRGFLHHYGRPGSQQGTPAFGIASFGAAILGFGLAILSFSAASVPLLIFSCLLILGSIVLGIIGVTRGKTLKGLSIAGLVLGSIFVIPALLSLLIVGIFGF